MADSTTDFTRALVQALDSARAAAAALTSDDQPKSVRSFASSVSRSLGSLADEARALCQSMETTDWGDVEKATWPTSYVDKLPDSAFLYVAPGGSKDAEGKTTPRSLRHLPVKDAGGKPDRDHVANALSRAPQADIPEEARVRAVASAHRMLAELNKGA